MKRDEIKKLLGDAATDEVLDQLMALHGKSVEAGKTALTAAQAEITGLKKQVEEAGAQIEKFKDLDIEGVKKTADEWKTKAEEARTEADAQIAKLKFDHALDSALTGAKAKSPKAVKALLDADLLKLADDGKISGLKEQLETLQKDNDYLFESDAPAPKVVTGGKGTAGLADAAVSAMRKAAGLPTE